jgi:hypothetical protein
MALLGNGASESTEANSDDTITTLPNKEIAD